MRTRASLLFSFLLIGLWCVPAGAQSAEKLFEAGRRAFRDGLYVMAGRNFRQLHEQYPDSPFADDAAYLLGVTDFYLGEFQNCVATLKSYDRKYPRSGNNRRVAYWLGSAYFQLLEFSKARTQLSIQVEKYPDEQPYFDHALLLKGMVEENLSEWAAAKQSYGRLLTRDTARDLWPEALYRSGGLSMRSTDYSAALTDFSRILVEFPDSVYADEAVFFVGECHFFLGRYGEAERSYRSALAGEPPSEQWQTSLYRLALVLAELDRSREALEVCRELEHRFPASRYLDELIRFRADLFFDLERYQEAYTAYHQSLAVSSSAEERQVIHYNMGLSAFLEGDLARSLEPLEKALEGRSEITEQSLFRLSAALAELGHDREAVRRLQEFRRRFPSSDRREEIGRVLAALHYRSGARDQAVALYTELITRYPDSSFQDEYLFKRGSSHLQAGSTAAALKDFFSLIERRPDSPYVAESSYNIGYIYSQRGEYNRATPYFEDVLLSDPSEELAGRSVLAAGVCAFNAGSYAEAIEWFGKNCSGSRISDGASAWVGESWFYLGRTHYMLEQLEEAVDTFGRAAKMLENLSQREEALFWKGLSEFRLNWLGEAKKTFLSLCESYPGGRRVAESYYRAGICASQADSYPESIGYFDKALEAAKTAVAPSGRAAEYREQLKQEILYQKGLSYLNSGERKKALETSETLSREHPGSTLASEAFFKIAEEDFRNGSYEKAVGSFVFVKEHFPDTPAAATALYWAGVSAARQGKRSSALEYLIGYLEEGSSKQSSGGLAELAMQEIRVILSEISAAGGAEEGEKFESFFRRVDRSPSLDREFKNRVRLEYARFIFADRPEGAIAVLQAVRADNPAEPLASEVNFLIGEYYRSSGDLDRAFDIFTGIVAANSGQPGAASQLGIAQILESRGKSQEAAEEYLKVHFLYPDHAEEAAEGLYSAGRLYWEQGYGDKAAQLFEKLGAEYPDSPWLEKLPQNEAR